MPLFQLTLTDPSSVPENPARCLSPVGDTPALLAAPWAGIETIQATLTHKRGLPVPTGHTSFDERHAGSVADFKAAAICHSSIPSATASQSLAPRILQVDCDESMLPTEPPETRISESIPYSLCLCT